MLNDEQDVNEIASRVVKKTVKNPHAVALGNLGGSKGGKARAARLSSERRKEIARKAIKTRWDKRNKNIGLTK